MFRAAPMTQLTVLVLARDERPVLRALGQLGAMQLVRMPAGPETAPLDAPDPGADLGRCDRLVAQVEATRRALGIGLTPGPSGGEFPEWDLDQAEEQMRAIDRQVTSLVDQRQRGLAQWGELTAFCGQVAAYGDLDIPLGRFEGDPFLHFVAGRLPETAWPAFQAAVGARVVLIPLRKGEGQQSLVAITTRDGRRRLEGALNAAGFQRARLPEERGGETVAARAAKAQHAADEAAAAVARVDAQLRRLAGQVEPSLAAIEAAARIERRLLEAERNFPRTRTAILVSGWVPLAEVPALEARVKAVAGGRCAIRCTAAEGVPEEEVPVLLPHGRVLRPFGKIMAAYGLPAYGDVEPTLFVAFSALFLFGAMFGDVGHGAILAIAGMVGLLAGGTRAVRDASLAILCGGLSSLLFGAVYGSCFGLPAFKPYALWRDPLEGDLMKGLHAAMGAGVVLISLGVVLNIINRVRHRDLAGALLDKFGLAGLWFYWGALALILRPLAGGASPSAGLFTLICLGPPLAGWVLKGPLMRLWGRRAGSAQRPESPATALATSVLEGFEAALSFLANTVSFVRLAAYALSHAALLMATFAMAAAFGQVDGWGPALSLLVLVLGNAVVLVLEGLVGAVQTLRLEYYEFFGKFIGGNGRPFQPFTLAAEG